MNFTVSCLRDNLYFGSLIESQRMKNTVAYWANVRREDGYGEDLVQRFVNSFPCPLWQITMMENLRRFDEICLGDAKPAIPFLGVIGTKCCSLCAGEAGELIFGDK